MSLVVQGHTVLPATRHIMNIRAREADTQFTYPTGMEGCGDLGDQLHTKMVYLPTYGHPSK